MMIWKGKGVPMFFFAFRSHVNFQQEDDFHPRLEGHVFSDKFLPGGDVMDTKCFELGFMKLQKTSY